MEHKYEPIKFIHDLMEGKSQEQIEEAEENFRRYLAVVKRICLRMEDEEERENLKEKIN